MVNAWREQAPKELAFSLAMSMDYLVCDEVVHQLYSLPSSLIVLQTLQRHKKGVSANPIVGLEVCPD